MKHRIRETSETHHVITVTREDIIEFVRLNSAEVIPDSAEVQAHGMLIDEDDPIFISWVVRETKEDLDGRVVKATGSGPAKVACDSCSGFGYTKGSIENPWDKVDCVSCGGSGKKDQLTEKENE